MDEPVRRREPGDHRRFRDNVLAMRLALAAGAALALGGCSVNPAFRQTVGQFGTVTKEAVGQQNERLAVIASNEAERIRADLAARRAILVLDPQCASVLTMPSGPGDSAAPAAQCKLLVQGGELEQAPAFEHVLALSAALSGYSDTLIALAADSTADQQAFTSSLSGLALSLGKLDGAIQDATGATPADRSAKYGAVATLLAEAGNLYFDHKRNEALKRIILAGDPLVQEATGLLSGVGAGIDLYDRTALGRALFAAQDAAQETAADPSQSVIAVRSAQDKLFAALDAYNDYGADRRQFAEIGAAHARLAEAARRGASAAEIRAAIEAVVKLASTTDATIKALKNQSGSTDNGNQGQ
jgi:hypothetical protein